VVLIRNSRQIYDNHPLFVAIRRNVQLWGQYPAKHIERHVVIERCMSQFQDWFYQDDQGLVTPIPQVEAYILMRQKFAEKWRAHLRIVEQESLPDVSERVFLQASRHVGDDVYEQFDDFRTVVGPNGSEVLRLDVDPHGKIIVYYNFVSLCYQYITLL
jgi:predicted ATPase